MATIWDEIITDVSLIVNAIEPVIDVLNPTAGAAVTVAAQVISGVAAAEPTAVSLYNQITSGATPTAAQLQALVSNRQAAFQKLNADITAQLAADGQG